MIFDFFIYLAGFFLYVISGLFGGVLSYVVPDQIQSAFVQFFSYVYVFQGIFPVSDLLEAFVFILNVFFGIYFIKFILFLWSLVPFIGRVVNLPEHSSSVTVSSDKFSYTVNRSARSPARYRR